MPLPDVIPARVPPDAGPRTAFLVVDTESVPDGELLARVKYPDQGLTPEQAVEKARAQARESSWNGSDFLPVTFQFPVAVCVINVGKDFDIQKITCLDAPLFRPAEIVQKFWKGVEARKAKLVTFNGRGFDLPLLEFAAYRQRVSMANYLNSSRNRFGGGALDLQEFFTNYGACRMVGGLDLLAKMIGLPGKLDVSGGQVLEMYQRGELQAINDYCLFDTLDTYFIFLRSRVMTGELDREEETKVVAEAREFLEGQTVEFPAVARYLAAWG